VDNLARADYGCAPLSAIFAIPLHLLLAVESLSPPIPLIILSQLLTLGFHFSCRPARAFCVSQTVRDENFHSQIGCLIGSGV
jgi:hypothetical protein